MGARHAEAEISLLLADLWQRHLPSTRDRLNTIDMAALLAASGSLDEVKRAEAVNVAHKLAGNLGMFGHREAGSVASEIEHILKAPTQESLLHLATLARQLRHSLSDHL